MGWFFCCFKRSSIIALVLFVSVVSTFSQAALSMPVFDRSDGSTVVVPINIDLLWDQSDDPSDTDIVSQDFIDGAPFDVFDTRAADDFLIPEGLLWLIKSVKVFGTFEGAAPDTIQSLDVVFYEDEEGFPGAIVERCNFVNILPVDINDPSFLIELPKPCILNPGEYWMSVRANMLFLPNGQWFWNERTTQTLNPFVWENPGNGFNTGCTSYAYASIECGASFPDLTFQLMGDEQEFPKVPVLNSVGLTILVISLGVLLVIYFRRTKKSGHLRS